MRVSEGSMGRVFKSKVSKTMERSESVRTTVPEAVAAILGAQPGSTLIWEVEPRSWTVRVSIDAPRKASKRS